MKKPIQVGDLIQYHNSESWSDAIKVTSVSVDLETKDVIIGFNSGKGLKPSTIKLSEVKKVRRYNENQKKIDELEKLEKSLDNQQKMVREQISKLRNKDK